MTPRRPAHSASGAERRRLRTKPTEHVPDSVAPAPSERHIPGHASQNPEHGQATDAAADVPAQGPGRRRSRWAWLGRLWGLSTGRFGLIVVAVVVITAVVARFWTPFDPQQVEISNRWAPPGWPHLLGTDGSGRDILSLIIAGARTTVLVAVGAGIVATVIGIALAALGALTARWVRESVAVLVDILIAFPVLIIAMMISAVWGGSLWVVIWAVGIGFGVNIARVTRPELRRVLHSDFVLAGRAAGLTSGQNLWRHLMPNVAPVFIVQLSWGMAVAVLAEAGLSYLGFGAPVTEPSWGLLLAELQQFITVHPLSVVWPGLAITLTVLGLNLLGDGLREATDPTLSRSPFATRRAGPTGASPQTPGAQARPLHIPEVVA